MNQYMLADAPEPEKDTPTQFKCYGCLFHIPDFSQPMITSACAADISSNKEIKCKRHSSVKLVHRLSGEEVDPVALVNHYRPPRCRT